MKTQIRTGVFETNSSSTHTITICTEAEFEKWVSDLTLYNVYDHCFVDRKEIPEEKIQELMEDYYDSIKKEFFKDYKDLSAEELGQIRNKVLKEYDVDDEEDFVTYDEWDDDRYLETFEKRYTSPSGDKLVIFGKYGYDG